MDNLKDIWEENVRLKDSESLIGRDGVEMDYRNEWKEDEGKIVNKNIYGIENIYKEFMGKGRVGVEDKKLYVKKEVKWGGVGIGGRYDWDEKKYLIYGEGDINK